MQKKQTIKIPAKPATTKEVITYGCDICGWESKSKNYFITCCSCGRFVCQAGRNSCHRVKFDDCSDYADWYCKICYELRFTKYDKDYISAEVAYDKRIESLDALIKEESLAHD